MTDVAPATAADEDEWERYAFERGQLAHSWVWQKIFRETFGHESHYLIARRGGVVRGILPLVELRSVLFGSALISVPYLNGGGILADEPSAFEALLHVAVESARKLGATYLELRHRSAQADYGGHMPLRMHKVALVLDLMNDPQVLFDSFPAKLRSQIRRPGKSGVSAESHAGTSPALSAFYAVFSENMRDLGTPVYPLKLFRHTALCFGDRARIIVAHHGGAPVAAGMTIGFGNTVEIPWASSIRRFNPLSVNMSLYWEAMRRACEEHYTTFDFGRSTPGSGTHRFKLQWGAREVPLHWYYPLGTPPDVSPTNPRYSLLVKCWRRLPLPVANALGPWLTKGLP